jgi:hypothetical protein
MKGTEASIVRRRVDLCATNGAEAYVPDGAGGYAGAIDHAFVVAWQGVDDGTPAPMTY